MSRWRRTAAAAAVVGALAAGTVAAGCSREPARTVAALCQRLDAAQGLDEALGTADPTTLDARAADLRAAVKVAPPDIEPQLATLSGAVDAVASSVDTATGDRRQAALAALGARQGDVGALASAGAAVSAWSVANCGLDLDTGTTVATTAPPAPGPSAPASTTP